MVHSGAICPLTNVVSGNRPEEEFFMASRILFVSVVSTALFVSAAVHAGEGVIQRG